MQRKVYLKGELADLYLPELTVHVRKLGEIFSCLEANFGGLRKYLLEAHEKGVGFTIFVADKSLENEEDLLLPLDEGDVVITPIPAGSGGGGGKILAAVAIVGVLMIAPYLAPAAGGFGASFGSAVAASGSISGALSAGLAGSLTTVAGQLAMGFAVNLAITGIQEIMAPDPSVDENEESYLFNGPEQNIVQGDPVPVLYGQLRIPGRPISFEIANRAYRSTTDSSTIIDQYLGFGGGGVALSDQFNLMLR